MNNDEPKIYTYDELKAELEKKREEEIKKRPKPKPYVRPFPKIGRNEQCPCGSGIKYKKCCGK